MSHFINLATAIAMTTEFRANKETITDPAYRGQNLILQCETFTRDAFDALLKQDDCVGIRIYCGMKRDMRIKLVAVGVNSQDEDILDLGKEVIVDEGLPCPTFCPPPSPLNI
jgi:hypothetical protein